MFSWIAWLVLLLFWILSDWLEIKKTKPSFWICWSLFFTGWTVAHIFNKLVG